MIYFPTKNILPNYRDFPTLYNHYSTFKGRDVYSSYIYWILKNNNIKNIKLVSELPSASREDTIFFHYDNLGTFNFNTLAKKIQFVSDRPLVNGCSFYLTSDITACNSFDKSKLLGSNFYILEKNYSVEMLYFPEPLPVNLKKCKVNYPPKKAVCMGLYDNIDKDLLKLMEEKQFFIDEYISNNKISKKNIEFIKNINFELYNESNNNKGDEDIFFFIRNKESGFNYAGYKHPNRLFISFFCNVPGFYYNEKVILANKKSDYDYIEISSAYDFVNKLIQYSTNEDLFLKVLKQIKQRENENNEEAVVNAFKKITQQLKI